MLHNKVTKYWDFYNGFSSIHSSHQNAQPPTIFPPTLLFCYNTKKSILYILQLQLIIIHALNLTQKKLNFFQNKKHQSLQQTPEIK